jgi:hypothetical protein
MVFAAATLQFLLAAAFVLMPIAGHRYGQAAQCAAEEDVARQGFSPTLLAQNRVSFTAEAAGSAISVGIALCMAALGVLNLAGNETGRLLTWILQPILFVAGGLTTAGQVFTVAYVRSAFRKSADATLQRIDVKSFAGAAVRAFPGWFRPLVAARFALATLGSAAIVVLLALPSANAYFA